MNHATNIINQLNVKDRNLARRIINHVIEDVIIRISETNLIRDLCRDYSYTGKEDVPA